MFRFIAKTTRFGKFPQCYFRRLTTSSSTASQMENICINTIRMLSADQPFVANSGHPGAPMGCAPMAHVLFGKIMKFNPRNPNWSNRDRFVLSNGHACALQYSMLYLTGYDLSLDDLRNFRKLGSKCPGHPENGITPGVEVSTGPLGQGISNAVGLAIAEKHLAAEFNKQHFNVVDHYTYVICGDGCLQEGVSAEASSLAGHLGLGKLIVLYDDNKITIDGHTSISFTEDVMKRYEAYGWHVQTVADGNYDHHSIMRAVVAAKEVTDRPSLIKVSTIIGLGSAKQNTHGVHGAPLKADDLANTKKLFGLPEDVFTVSDEVRAFYDKTVVGSQLENEWSAMLAQYAASYPHEAAEFIRRQNGELPKNWKECLPKYTPEDKPLATRKTSETCLNALAGAIPELVGGSADLTPSNLTALSMSVDFQRDTPRGRYFHFGVREHAMAAICNGIFAHGALRPFCATFLNFIGYALGAVRLSALSQFGVIFIATHDSIFLGEDGPTHQPIEMCASLRAMPHTYVFRPADGNEVSGSYAWALEHRNRPSVLALTRQGLQNLAGSSIDNVYKGGYILSEHGIEASNSKPDLILVASGSEVNLATAAAKRLSDKRVRVVSMPCMDLFAEQSVKYRKSVLGSGVPVLAIEAGTSFGWHQYSHSQLCLDDFGASGNENDLAEKFGFTVENVVVRSRFVLEFYSDHGAPCLFDRPDIPKASNH